MKVRQFDVVRVDAWNNFLTWQIIKVAVAEDYFLISRLRLIRGARCRACCEGFNIVVVRSDLSFLNVPHVGSVAKQAPIAPSISLLMLCSWQQ
jgi:hypothetical protein